MTDIILHHYETSPYAEKVRLGLGLKGLAWASVEIPVIMPKPDLTALTGGYSAAFRALVASKIGQSRAEEPRSQARTRAAARGVSKGTSS
jgi:hypothetical protein